MNPSLRLRLRDLRSAGHRISPDPVWVRATRETLFMQVENSLPVHRLSLRKRVTEFFRMMVAVRVGRMVRQPIMGLLSIVAVALGGSILSVSAAERSLPGDFFYGLKLVTEQARLALTATKEDKLKLKTEFTTRRVSELKQIATSDVAQQAQVVQVAEILKRDMNTLKQQLTEVNQEVPRASAVAAAKLVDQKTNEVISDLQATKAQLPASTKEAVTDVQSAAADAGIKAIEVLAQQHQDASVDVPTEDIAQAIQDHAKVVSEATSSTLPIGNASSSLALNASTTIALVNVSSSASIVITTSTLPALVDQVKDLTVQAFAIQKEKDQLAAAAEASSTSSGISTASSTDVGEASVSGSVSSTSSTAPASTSTSETITPTSTSLDASSTHS